MTLNIEALGKRIRTLRKKRGLSQNELSEMIDKSSTYLSYIENGTKCMSLDTFVDLANELNTTADDLLRDSINLTAVAVNNSFAEIIADCSDYEQRVLLELAAAAKQALRDNAVSAGGFNDYSMFSGKWNKPEDRNLTFGWRIPDMKDLFAA